MMTARTLKIGSRSRVAVMTWIWYQSDPGTTARSLMSIAMPMWTAGPRCRPRVPSDFSSLHSFAIMNHIQSRLMHCGREGALLGQGAARSRS
jgi:hypothetical protein